MKKRRRVKLEKLCNQIVFIPTIGLVSGGSERWHICTVSIVWLCFRMSISVKKERRNRERKANIDRSSFYDRQAVLEGRRKDGKPLTEGDKEAVVNAVIKAVADTGIEVILKGDTHEVQKKASSN